MHDRLRQRRRSWLLVALLAAGVAPSFAIAHAASLYTVAKLHIDVRAKNAVEAKKLALVAARARAARILFKRLAPFNSGDRLPRVKARLIEDMLEGFSVRRERNSSTRYLATLDFSFRKVIVDRLLTGYGIAIADRQAAPVALLPIYISKGRVETSGRDLWRKAWARLDLGHAVTPVKLKPVTAKLTLDVVNAILQGDNAAYARLLGQYKARRLVLAIAMAEEDGILASYLIGADQAGSLSIRRRDRFKPRGLKAAANRSAKVSMGILEGRWKMARGQADGGAGESRLMPVSLIVEFSGLRQWQAIRSRLTAVPGVQALNVTSLSARSARVGLQYPGGAERLSAVVASHRLALQSQGDSWVLSAVR